MLAELAMLEGQLESDQTSLKRIVFGASSSDEPVPDQMSSSQIIRSGSQWTGTLGCCPYHLVFCWRDESWLEAVGIYPGVGASRIEGDISVSQVCAVPPPRGPLKRAWCSDLPSPAPQDGRAVHITLKEVERLAGSWQQPSPSHQLELDLLGHKLHGRRGEVRPPRRSLSSACLCLAELRACGVPRRSTCSCGTSACSPPRRLRATSSARPSRQRNHRRNHRRNRNRKRVHFSQTIPRLGVGLNSCPASRVMNLMKKKGCRE